MSADVLDRVRAGPDVVGLMPARERQAGLEPRVAAHLLIANLETGRAGGSPAAVADQRGVALWHELGCGVGRRRCGPKALADRLTCAGEQTPGAVALVTERASAVPPSSLLRWTSSDSAAFARASTTALAGEGRATGIARASVDGVELHMHPDVGVCSIRYDELIAVLLLRQQREHAVQPAPGLWNGRNGAALIAAAMR